MQFGVQMPGGCEALYHARATIEKCAAKGALGDSAVVDVEMVNFFGSVEWQPMLETYADIFPEGLQWEAWATEQHNRVSLPCGDELKVNRGAGQGEIDGPLKAFAALSRSACAARTNLQRQGVSSAHAWYMDDGQLFCRPADLDKVLKQYDDHINKVGATRGSRTAGNDVKSMVRVFHASGRTQTSGGWQTDHVKQTPTKLLGGALGDRDQQIASFCGAVHKTSQLHEAISGVSDPATQLALRLACAGVCKVAFLLRLFGDRLSEDCFTELNKVQRLGLAITLQGDVGGGAWEQAQLGIDSAGLGMRDAEEIALPAFVASRVAARPVAKRVFAMMETEGLALNGLLLAEYDARTDAAVDKMLQSLASTSVVVNVVRSDLRRAVEAAESW